MNKADFKVSFPNRHACGKCKYAFHGKRLSLSEKNKTMLFENPNGHPVDVVAVDTCWLPQQTACDYLVLDWLNRLYLVELKGVRVKDALDQLEATLLALIPRKTAEKILCFLIALRIPRGEIQNRIKKLRRDWSHINIIPKSRQHTHQLTDEG